jgi:hypothetical protein
MGWIVRGHLIFNSDYLPRLLGVLMLIGGLGFVANGFARVLAPDFAAGALLLLLLPGGLLLAAWLLVNGVDVSKWEVKAKGVSHG